MSGAPLILENLLAIEVGAARIEGALLADPELGRVWRVQAALTEACRSVGMEDIAVREGDLATRPVRVSVDDGETARGVWLAAQTLRVLLSPGDLFADPQRVVRRCLQNGLRAEGAEEPLPEGDAELADRVLAAARDAPGPLIGALRAALTLRTLTGSASPSAERLLFMCTDHTIRGGRAGRELIDPLPEGLGLSAGPGEPRWVLLPSTGLSTDGYRVWSPGSVTGLPILLEGLRREVGRGLGQLPTLRRWRDQAVSACTGRHGKSRLRDLIHLLMSRPIVTGQIVAEELGVTPRAALNLVDEAVAAGLLEELTRRRSYRAWVVAPMASRALSRSGGGRGRAQRAPDLTPDLAPAPDHGPDHGPYHERTEAERAGIRHRARPERDLSGEEAALAELDAAMAAADRVLEKYRPR